MPRIPAPVLRPDIGDERHRRPLLHLERRLKRILRIDENMARSPLKPHTNRVLHDLASVLDAVRHRHVTAAAGFEIVPKTISRCSKTIGSNLNSEFHLDF